MSEEVTLETVDFDHKKKNYYLKGIHCQNLTVGFSLLLTLFWSTLLYFSIYFKDYYRAGFDSFYILVTLSLLIGVIKKSPWYPIAFNFFYLIVYILILAGILASVWLCLLTFFFYKTDGSWAVSYLAFLHFPSELNPINPGIICALCKILIFISMSSVRKCFTYFLDIKKFEYAKHRAEFEKAMATMVFNL